MSSSPKLAVIASCEDWSSMAVPDGASEPAHDIDGGDRAIDRGDDARVGERGRRPQRPRSAFAIATSSAASSAASAGRVGGPVLAGGGRDCLALVIWVAAWRLPLGA